MPSCSPLQFLRLACLILTLMAFGGFGHVTDSYAATQGTTQVGQSDGSLDLAVTSGLTARINGLNDINLGTWSGSGGLTGSDDLCIGRSGVGLFAQGAYRMRLDGDGDAYDVNAFTLSNGTNLLHYDVWFNDAIGAAGQQAVSAGVMMNSQTGSGFWQFLNMIFGCVGTNANVQVDISEAQLLAVPAGSYTGTLTLVLIPE